MIIAPLRNTNLTVLTIVLMLIALLSAGSAKASTLPEDASQELFDTLSMAKSGDAVAMYEIALYLNARAEEGAEENYQLAFGWALNAARKGHPEAAELTGSMYRQGFGIEQNYIKARKWLERALARNSKEPNFELAILYADENNPGRDKKRAAELLANAIRRNEPRACLVAARNKLNQGEAFKQALPQVRCAANGGLIQAMLTLADYHLNRRSPDALNEAKRWLEIAAEKGSEDAASLLLELPEKK